MYTHRYMNMIYCTVYGRYIVLCVSSHDILPDIGDSIYLPRYWMGLEIHSREIDYFFLSCVCVKTSGFDKELGGL